MLKEYISLRYHQQKIINISQVADFDIEINGIKGGHQNVVPYDFYAAFNCEGKHVLLVQFPHSGIYGITYIENGHVYMKKFYFSLNKERIMNKKIIFVFVLLVLPLSILAFDFEEGGIYYDITGDKTVSVTKGDKKYAGSIVLPATVSHEGTSYAVTSVSERAFEMCGQLLSVTLQDGIGSIGEGAFASCTALTEVNLPSSIRTIGQEAFYATEALEEILLPEGLEHLGAGVFHYSRLSDVVVPSTVTKIDGGFMSGKYASSAGEPSFYVKSLQVAKNNPNYHSNTEQTAIIETSTGRLVQGCGSTVVPEEVKVIGNHAFFNCKSLETTLLPTGVEEIESKAFAGCASLRTLYCRATVPPACTTNMFGLSRDASQILSNCTLYVPTGCREAYEGHECWKRFKEIVEMDADVMGIEFSVNADQQPFRHIYDLQGRHMTATKHGVNIVGHRKIIIK